MTTATTERENCPASLQNGRVLRTTTPPDTPQRRPQDHPKYPGLLRAIRDGVDTTALQREIGFPNRDVLILRGVWADFERLQASVARAEDEIAAGSPNGKQAFAEAEAAIGALRGGIAERSLSVIALHDATKATHKALLEHEAAMLKYRNDNPALLTGEGDYLGVFGERREIIEPRENHDLWPALARAIKHGEDVAPLQVEIGFSDAELEAYRQTWQAWRGMEGRRDTLKADHDRATAQSSGKVKTLRDEIDTLSKQLVECELLHGWLYAAGQGKVAQLGMWRVELRDLKAHYPQLLSVE